VRGVAGVLAGDHSHNVAVNLVIAGQVRELLGAPSWPRHTTDVRAPSRQLINAPPNPGGYAAPHCSDGA